MPNSKKTRKALLASAVSLLLCIAMLIGSTFAWFTDTAQTGVNKIQAGKLDVVLEVATEFDDEGTPTAWTEVTEDMELFKNVNGEDIIWEPGAGAQEWFRIRNNGNLALKYQFMTNYANATETDDGKTLADILKVQNVACDIENGEYDGRGSYTDMTGRADVDGYAPMKNAKYEEYLLPGEARTVYTCIVWEPTDHDNDFNVAGGLSIDLGIKVIATQYTYEYDSRDNQYDRNAGFGWDGTVATQEQLAAVTDTTAKTVKIDSPELLAAFAVSVNNGNTYHDYKVTLEEDIDLGNQDWTPIGNSVFESTGANVVSGYFCGNFDGQGHTISNLKVNGGAENPIDTNASFQGLFGCLNAQGKMVYIQNLNIHNADIYAKNGAGAFVGNMYTYQHLGQSGQSNIWNCKLTGKVSIKGGNSGGIAGTYTEKWAILTSYQNIVIDVDEGSYVTNVGVEGGAGQIGGVAPVAAYSSGTSNITTNLDVIAKEGSAGGAFAVVGGKFNNITCTGDVIVKDVNASTFDSKSYAQVLGLYVPVSWARSYIKDNTLSATGRFEIHLTNGNVVTSNGQATNLVGGRAW